MRNTKMYMAAALAGLLTFVAIVATACLASPADAAPELDAEAIVVTEEPETTGVGRAAVLVKRSAEAEPVVPVQAPETVCLTLVESELETEAPETEELATQPAEEPAVPEPEIVWTELDECYAVLIAKTLWGECRDCAPIEQAAVVWCVLNRVDSPDPWLPDDIAAVITQPRQFAGYSPDYPVTEDLLNMARDVMTRWYAEKQGVEDVGRVLPREYLSFHGDEKKQHNLFTVDGSGAYWDWSLPDPYGVGYTG